MIKNERVIFGCSAGTKERRNIVSKFKKIIDRRLIWNFKGRRLSVERVEL